MGVCRILNKVNGKCLVESARDVDARLNRHMAEMKMGTHRNKVLQGEWNSHGPEAFAFECVDVLEPREDPAYDPDDDLEELLALWIDKLAPFGAGGYNRP